MLIKCIVGCHVSYVIAMLVLMLFVGFFKKKSKQMTLMWSFHIFRLLNNWQSNQLLFKMTQRKKRGTIIEIYKNYINLNLTSTLKCKHAFKCLWRLIDVYVCPFETTYVHKKVGRTMNTFSGYKTENCSYISMTNFCKSNYGVHWYKIC
jgi:hypothetical protein